MKTFLKLLIFVYDVNFKCSGKCRVSDIINEFIINDELNIIFVTSRMKKFDGLQTQ